MYQNIKNLLDSLKEYIDNRGMTTPEDDSLLEWIEQVQRALTVEKRTLQVNVRLTVKEKCILSCASTTLGFTGLSDFIRSAALEKALSIK